MNKIPTSEQISELELDQEALLEILRRVLDERKTMCEALSRVQGRCTDLVEENRELQRQIDSLRRTHGFINSKP